MCKKKQYRIRTNNRNTDLRFTGEEVASWSNRIIGNGGDSSRWREWDLYKTDSGKFVYIQNDVTLWQGESDRKIAKIFDSLDAVGKYFISKTDRLTTDEKEFLDQCGIELIEDI